MIERSPKCPLFMHPPVKQARSRARLALIKKGHKPQPYWTSSNGNMMDAQDYRLDCSLCGAHVLVYASICDWDGPAVREICKVAKEEMDNG